MIFLLQLESRNILCTQQNDQRRTLRQVGAPLSGLLVYQVSASQPPQRQQWNKLWPTSSYQFSRFEISQLSGGWLSRHLRMTGMRNGRLSISALTPCYQKMNSRCTFHLYPPSPLQDITNPRQIPQAWKLWRSSTYSQQPRPRCNAAYPRRRIPQCDRVPWSLNGNNSETDRDFKVPMCKPQ